MSSTNVSRRQFLTIAMAAGGGALAAACVPAAAPMPGDEAASEGAEAPAMEALELKLTTLGGVGWPEAMEILAAEHEERTGNKVVLDLVNWPLLDTVLPALAAGEPPDVYHDHSTKFFTMFSESTVLTLNPYVEAADWSPDDLSPMDMQAHTWVDGSIKGVPLWTDLSTGHFFAYREDYFDEAGIPRPSSHGGFDSYTHLWDVAQKLTQTDASGNVTRWGWSSDIAYLGFRILNLVLDLGGHWWDEGKQEFNLTSDEVIEALDTYLIEPIRLGAAYDEDHAPEQSRNEQLPEGVAAMSSSTFSIRTAEDSHPDVAEVMAHAEAPPINPDLPNEQRHYVGWGGFGGLIPAAIPSDRHQAAFELAEAQLKSPATTQAIHRHIGPPGASKEYVNDPFLEELSSETRYTAATVDMYRWQMARPGAFFGWQWGELGMANWIGGPRCYGGILDVTSEAAQARCEQTGSVISMKITVEEIAEEWQEWAMHGYENFFLPFVES